MRLRTIILAPDSFKETLPAEHVASAMAAGVRRASDAIIAHECPVADGGEGTMHTLVKAAGGELLRARVAGPLGSTVEARYGLIQRDHGGRLGVVELAEASGLALVKPGERDRIRATTFGAGQLILRAIDAGCEEIIVCLGGSATVDGGTGMAQACGWRFFDSDGREIREYMCGGLLNRMADIQPPEREFPLIRAACDVSNPLCGENGAAAVYGPQKGAAPEQVRLLDAGLGRLARVVYGRPDQPGAGAAGGAGFGLMTFFNATLEPGIELVLRALRFGDRCRDADLVITGEGRLDAQSLSCKACMGVARAAAELGVPTVAIVGAAGEGAQQCLAAHGGWLQSYIALADRFGPERAMREAPALIADACAEFVREHSV